MLEFLLLYHLIETFGILIERIQLPLNEVRRQQLNPNTDTNWQVKTFTDIFLNIMSNFMPIETKRFVPRDPTWINKSLKTMLTRKNRLFKNY